MTRKNILDDSEAMRLAEIYHKMREEEDADSKEDMQAPSIPSERIKEIIDQLIPHGK